MKRQDEDYDEAEQPTSPLKKLRSAERHPWVGKFIKIWFESDKCYYEAQIKTHKKDDSFEIFWIKEEAEEVMDLKEADLTEDVANEDRWSILPDRPVKKVAAKTTDDDGEEKDDGDEYRDEGDDGDDYAEKYEDEKSH